MMARASEGVGFTDRTDERNVFLLADGRVREQRHVQWYGELHAFLAYLEQRAAGLDDPRVIYTTDVGDGTPGFWVEGTRVATPADREWLQQEATGERDSWTRQRAYCDQRIAAYEDTLRRL